MKNTPTDVGVFFIVGSKRFELVYNQCMKNIYLTSTFRHEWNVKFNSLIGDALESKGITCYLAHRDTDQAASPEVKFKSDIAGIDDSSIILAIAENESPNWGAEVGYAYGKRKKIIALKSKVHSTPIICAGMLTQTLEVENLNEIESYIDNLVRDIKSLI